MAQQAQIAMLERVLGIQHHLLSKMSESEIEAKLWTEFKSEKDDNKKVEILQKINESRAKQNKPLWDKWKPNMPKYSGKYTPVPKKTTEEKLADAQAFYAFLELKNLVKTISPDQMAIVLCSVFNGK